MSGSFIFYFHLIGFGLLSAAIVGAWILNVRLVSEPDASLKLYVGGMMRILGLLFPLAALLLLATGIGNIFNLYYGTAQLWYQQGWLVIKIILFAALLVNGVLFGPSLSRKRLKIVHLLKDETASEEDHKQLKELNKQISWFFVVQTVMLLGIIFFSTFGTSKHPGYF